jgi:hypothetical protein
MDWRWGLGISPDTAPQGRPPATFYDGIRKKSETTFDNVKGRRNCVALDLSFRQPAADP